MKNLLKISLVFVIISLIYFSCEQPTQPDQATGRDVRIGDLAVSDVFTFSTSETGGGKLYSDTNCYTVETVINQDTTRTTTITFDPTCTFEDGYVRGGQIIINWEFGWLWDTTKVVTVTFNQYSLNGNVLAGEIEIRFLRGSIDNSPTHYIVEKDMSIELADQQGTTTWEGTRTIVWEQGAATIFNKSDNVVLIDLYKDGVNRNGEHYIAEGEDVKVDHTCGNGAKITDGIVTITKDDGTETIIDFGDGACDDSFTVTQNGTSVIINP